MFRDVLALVAVIFGVVLFLFSTLTVAVTDGYVKCIFGLLIRKKILLKDIGSVEKIRMPFYWGWGIKWTSKGWMYRVSGFDGVLFKLKNGKNFIVGSDEAAKLLDVINMNVKL